MKVSVDKYGEVVAESDDEVFIPGITIQGGLVTIAFRESNCVPPEKKKDQIINEFSPGARLRLLKQVATIDWDKLPRGLFVTLTYPDDRADVEVRTATIQRHRFIRDTETYLQAKIPILWRKEQQKRKSGTHTGKYVSHFHLCVFSERFVPHAVVRDIWRKILGTTGALCTDVKRMRSGEHAAFYLAKYLSKPRHPSSLDYGLYLNKPGRAWGWHRKDLVPLHEPRYLTDLAPMALKAVYDEARRLRKIPDEWSCPSITLLGNNAFKMIEKLHREFS